LGIAGPDWSCTITATDQRAHWESWHCIKTHNDSPRWAVCIRQCHIFV